jgi:hypothetical protein
MLLSLLDKTYLGPLVDAPDAAEVVAMPTKLTVRA